MYLRLITELRSSLVLVPEFLWKLDQDFCLNVLYRSSSMDSLLETRSPARFSATSPSAEQQISPPIRNDSRPTTRHWETNGNSDRGRSEENYRRRSHTFDFESNPGTREPRSDFEPSSPSRLVRQQSIERTAPVSDNRLVISDALESDLDRKPVEEEPGPPSNNDDNEVFWDADDSFPPPPPLQLLDPLETSQDSLPLPSPPREVLVEFPPSYSDPVEMETYQQNGKNCSDIIKPEKNAQVESSVEISEEPKIELNGTGKIDTSGVSDQAFETSSSTDLSSKDTSPAESKRMSTQRAPPPPPLVLTSTPTKDELSNTGSYLDVSTSPYSGGSNISTPSNSCPNSMFSPKLEKLDKEKVKCCTLRRKKLLGLNLGLFRRLECLICPRGILKTIGHCRNVRGLGKSMVVFRLFEKLKIFNREFVWIG